MTEIKVKPGIHNNMRIHVHSVCYNEERLLPYFLRYYSTIAQKIFIYDHDSTDGSRQIILESEKAILRNVEYKEGIPVNWQLLPVRNNAWKESKGEADWVIVCDMDEFVYHPDLLQFLENTNHTAFKLYGWNMCSMEFPTQDLFHVNRGCRINPDHADKILLFRPDAIKETNYSPGQHKASLRGDVDVGRDVELCLLHYRSLGTEFVEARNRANWLRKTADIKQGMSRHYGGDNLDPVVLRQKIRNRISQSEIPHCFRKPIKIYL